MPVEENAPAKLNLGLRITGKRDDGYHDILSIFQTVNFFDELTITSAAGSGLMCTEPGIPSGRDNLVIKAQETFSKHYGIPSQVTFSLKKRIPVGAGLGGGSSDAAAALRGLTRFHSIESSNEILRECAEELGSDIPFLLQCGTAIVSGRGERIAFVEWPFDFTYVIVYPGFGISTAWAYENLGKLQNDGGAYRTVIEKLKGGTLEEGEFFSALHNDFEPVVFKEYPALQGIKNSLYKCGACVALLTGSGSSVIGIFEDEENARWCARVLKNNNYRIFTVQAYI